MTRPTRAVPWDEINERRRDRAAKAPGVPRDVGACRSDNCRAAIRWGVTVDGKRIPVDVAPDPAGNLVRVMVARNDWRIRVLAEGEVPPPGTHRWTSHYATCPDADQFRNRGSHADSPGPAAAAAALAPLGATPIPAPRPVPVAASPSVLLVVDGNSLGHRAWHAYERSGMASPDGTPLFAVHGFLALLAGIIDRVRPDALVVGFDDRTTSVRRQVYPDYKTGRAATDPDLYAQLDTLPGLLAELGVQVITPAGLEADDVLGSAAAAAEAAGWSCVIATSDKDAFGLISDTTTVLRLMSGLDNSVRMTPATLAEQYGVTPGQYLDYAALVGDTSDALPGVHGIGPKTAAKLLSALGSIDAALADPATTTTAIGKAAAAKLATPEARAAIDRNRQLMTIRRDVPVTPDTCRPTVDPATVAAVLRGRHLPGLIDRVTAALCPPPPGPSTPAPARRRDHLSAVPDQPAQQAAAAAAAAPPLVHADPPPVCPGCGRECAAALPLAQLDTDRRPTLTGEEILVDGEAPLGDLVAVLVGDVWAVRHVPAGEHYLRPGDRRRAHYCQVYPHTCAVPDCGEPARMYAAGPRCDRHVPSTPPAEPRHVT